MTPGLIFELRVIDKGRGVYIRVTDKERGVYIRVRQGQVSHGGEKRLR